MCKIKKYIIIDTYFTLFLLYTYLKITLFLGF